MAKKGIVDKLVYNYHLLFKPEKLEMPKGLSEPEEEQWLRTMEEERDRLSKKPIIKQVKLVTDKISKTNNDYQLLCLLEEMKVPKCSKEEKEDFVRKTTEEREKLQKSSAKIVKSILGRKLYNVRLLFNKAKIIVPEDWSDIIKEQCTKTMYEEKAKLHGKLGAKRFQKVVGKVDNTKYKLLNKLGEKRVLPIIDKLIDRRYMKYFEEAETDEERRLLEEDYKRSKVLARKQIKIGKSMNYYEGVDKRTELFPFYLSRNKMAHQNALIVDGIVLGSGILLKELVSVVTPFLLPIPIIRTIGVPVLCAIPIIMIGYQSFAIPKNIQCINIQEYNLSRMKAIEKKIVDRKMQNMRNDYDNNRELIYSIENAKEQQKKDLTTKDDISSFIDGLNNLDAIRQLREAIINEMGPREVPAQEKAKSISETNPIKK